MQKHSKYANKNYSELAVEINFYTQNPDSSEPLESYYPICKITQLKNPNPKNEIIRRHNEIVKLIRKEKLKWEMPDQRRVMEKIFTSIISKPPETSGEKLFKQEISFKPNLHQVIEIISNFETNLAETSIEDIGFKLSDQTIIMLKGSFLTKEARKEIILNENGFISSNLLKEVITNNKSYFFNDLHNYRVEKPEIKLKIKKSANMDLFENADQNA